MKKTILIICLLSVHITALYESETINLRHNLEDANKLLLEAIENNNPQALQEALKAGADVNKKLEHGRTILMESCCCGFKSELVPPDKPACIHCCDDQNAPWRVAYGILLENRRSIITMLLQAGARVNDCDDDGITALHLACIMNNDPLRVRLLIDASADVTVVSKHGRTALMEAITDGATAAAEILIDSGAHN